MSALHSEAGIISTRAYVGYVPILLQKSFCTGDQKFCGSQARFSCKNVGDLIVAR